MLLLGALGFSCGLPLKLVFATLSLWLVESGVSRAAVGVFALASLPYSFKFLWAPAFDHVKLPVLSQRLGKRRAWMLVTQLALAGAIAGVAMGDPTANPVATGVAAVFIAFFSASQDVVVDGYRVELLAADEQGAGAAVYVFGYRIGMLAAGAGVLHMVGLFDGSAWLQMWHHAAHGTPNYAWTIARDGWSLAYLVMAATMAIGIVATLLAPRPPRELALASAPAPARGERIGFVQAIVDPIRLFVTQHKGWALLVVIALFFKLSDALAGTMTSPFLYDVGFSRAEIADIRDTLGLIATLAGVALGGWVVRAYGVRRAMWISLVVMMASNFVFTAQAIVGHSTGFLVLTIGIENLAGGVGTSAFVAYLSGLCDPDNAATQYAVLSSIPALWRTLLGASSGLIATALGWPMFFAATALAAAPTALVLWWAHRTGVEVAPAEARARDASAAT